MARRPLLQQRRLPASSLPACGQSVSRLRPRSRPPEAICNRQLASPIMSNRLPCYECGRLGLIYVTTRAKRTSVETELLFCPLPIGRATNDPPWPQGLLPSKCTGPAMRLQTTVDQTCIRGLVTRIDRGSSGGFPTSRARASIESAIDYLLGFPTVASPPALCTYVVYELDSFLPSELVSGAIMVTGTAADRRGCETPARPDPRTIDHAATYLGPRCRIATRPSANFSKEPTTDPPRGAPPCRPNRSDGRA
jgi:hypothetical protein